MIEVKQAQEARDDQFLFQNAQNKDIFAIFKMFQNNCWINVYYAKSKRLLDWLFWSKNSNYQFELKFGTSWKVSKYGVISGPYFPVFGMSTGKYESEVTPYLDTFHSVWYLY